MLEGYLPRYLDRLGITGPVPPTEAALRRLHRAHMNAVPFENLDVRAGRPIRLDEASFVRKIVDGRRGGFCYELNTAFAWLLRSLGFEVALWSANVRGHQRWGIDYDHMLLHVPLDGPWIVDVGFGDSFVEPLRLHADVEQRQGPERYRLRFTAPFWHYERWTAEGDRFEPQYRFEPAARALDEFAPGLAYHQSPASHFTQGTVVSRATPTGRTTLRTDRLILTEHGQRREESVASKADYVERLRTDFLITGVQALVDADFPPAAE